MTITLAAPPPPFLSGYHIGCLALRPQHPGRKVQGPGTTGQSRRTQADAGVKPLRVSEGHHSGATTLPGPWTCLKKRVALFKGRRRA